MKTHKLMIKTHNKTGLKYLCYTRSEGIIYDNYKGSGKYWKDHLIKHGDDISTELIFESNIFDIFKTEAIRVSIEYDIVSSNKWANLKIEEGDGGDTVSNKRWITDGINDKYINKDLNLPEGWYYGRSKCVFNNPTNQSKFSSLCDVQKRNASIKKAWKEGKYDKIDYSVYGFKSENNPSKLEYVKQIIREANSKEITVKGLHFKSIKEATIYFNVCYKTINRWVESENREDK